MSSDRTTLEPGEIELLRVDPDAFVSKRQRAGDRPQQIRAKLESARTSVAVRPSREERFATDVSVATDRPRVRKNSGGAGKIIASVIVGVIGYILFVGIFMLVGVGRLVIQLPGLAVAVILGRGMYSFLKRPFGSGQGMN